MWIGGVLAVLAAAVLLHQWRRQPAADREAATPPPAARPASVSLTPEGRTAAGIEVQPAAGGEWPRSVDAVAVFAPDERRTTRLGAIIEGVVKQVSVEVGQRVGRGARLGSIASHLLHDTWADLRKAEAVERQRETELAFAREALARAERLFAAKAVSRQEVERTRTEAGAAQQQLELARAELRRARDELDHYGIDVTRVSPGDAPDEVPITTPMAGVVLERLVTAGTAVTVGTPMFVVSDVSSLWAIAEVDERALPSLAVGRPVTLRVAAYPGRTFEGRIEQIGDRVDPRTRRVTVRCAVPNPDGRLKLDMFATIALDAGAPLAGVAVPADAVQEMEGRQVVFVERSDGSFEPVAVEAGERLGDRVHIRSGLTEGQRIVTAGAFLLKSELLKGPAEDH